MIIKYIRIICTVALLATGTNLSFGELTKEQINDLQELLNCENVEDFCKEAECILHATGKNNFLKKVRKEIAIAKQNKNADLVTLLKKIKYEYQKMAMDHSLIKFCMKCGTLYAKRVGYHHKCQKSNDPDDNSITLFLP